MFRLSVLTLLSVAAAGCGPIEYVTVVTLQASRAVDEAKRRQAERYAPYEYTVAVESLHKARELAGHARWGDSIRFGKDALSNATKASTMAEEKRSRHEEPGE